MRNASQTRDDARPHVRFPRILDNLRLGGVFCFAQRIEKTEEVLHARDLKGVVYTIADAHESETARVFLVRNVGAHQRADASGIDIRHVGKVDDETTGVVRAHLGLEIEKRRDHQRPAKPQNALPILRAGDILNGKGL